MRFCSPALRMRHLPALLALLLCALAAVYAPAQAQEDTPAAPGAPGAPYTLYAPLVSYEYNPARADRIGYTAGIRPLDDYPDIRSLNAGWYVNWTVRARPARPGNIEFVQMVRLHQRIDSSVVYDARTNPPTMCGTGVTADRTRCPYATEAPLYTYSPSSTTIQAAARANPGSLWLIGNEMDRVDFAGGGQDEMMPALYAVAYHDLYTIIKAVDPTARIAIGGVIQATPLRLQYLDTVWESYRARYGVEMPVDVWNVHNFIGSEYCDTRKVNGRDEYVCFGMAVPPGANLVEASPAYIRGENLHINRTIFDRQIRTFRAWMKAKGEMNKPLIISEYGVLHQDLCPQTDPQAEQRCAEAWDDQPGGYIDIADPAVVHAFMLWSFDYFLKTRDCSLSAVDDCRLVQRWAWFSLDGAGTNFNAAGRLYPPSGQSPAQAGQLFSRYATENWRALRYDGP